MSNGNESAYPAPYYVEMHENAHDRGDIACDGGLTKRELIAAMAMQGLLSSTDKNTVAIMKTAADHGMAFTETLAGLAAGYADSLLAALAKEPT